MIAVIGDIHGCFYTFKQLVDDIREKYPEVPLYSVGDLIDRGNFSYEVFEYVIKNKITFTPGNHEYMFYYFMKQPGSIMGRAWLYNGSEATMRSYKDKMDIIPEHLDIILKAPLFLNLDDCFISHAGISSVYRLKLSENVLENTGQLEKLVRKEIESDHGILWCRDVLLNIGKLQIVGHSRQREVTLVKENNAAYIDTDAVGNNKLSAVIVEDGDIIDVLSVKTFPEDTR